MKHYEQTTIVPDEIECLNGLCTVKTWKFAFAFGEENTRLVFNNKKLLPKVKEIESEIRKYKFKVWGYYAEAIPKGTFIYVVEGIIQEIGKSKSEEIATIYRCFCNACKNDFVVYSLPTECPKCKSTDITCFWSDFYFNPKDGIVYDLYGEITLIFRPVRIKEGLTFRFP